MKFTNIEQIVQKRFISISILDIWLVNSVPIIGIVFFGWGLSEEFFYFTFELVFLWILALILPYTYWKHIRASHLLHFCQETFWIGVALLPILIIFTVNVYLAEYKTYEFFGQFLWQLRTSILLLLLNTLACYGRKWASHGAGMDRLIEQELAPRFMVINAYYGFSIILYHFFFRFYTEYFVSIAFWLLPLAKIVAETWGLFCYKERTRTRAYYQ